MADRKTTKNGDKKKPTRAEDRAAKNSAASLTSPRVTPSAPGSLPSIDTTVSVIRGIIPFYASAVAKPPRLARSGNIVAGWDNLSHRLGSALPFFRLARAVH